MTTNNLTELWKKGELPEGFYFVDDGAEVTIDYYLCDYWERHFDSYVQQVLAEVPDYIEWKNYVNGYCEEHNYNLKLQEENAKLKAENRDLAMGSFPMMVEAAEKIDKLKELLKRCRDFINYEVPDHCIDDVLIDKIDEALK